MFSSSVIEVAIGLAFIFLLLSLISSAIVEIIESVLKNRATDLERGIRELFNEEGGRKLAGQFFNHPMINGLYRGLYKRQDDERIGILDYLKSTNLPSYIPAKNFADAVLDLVMHPPAQTDVVRDDREGGGSVSTLDAPPLPASMEAIRIGIKRHFGSTQVGRALRTLAEQAGEDLNTMRTSVETWFDGAMDRVSGQYKRRTQWIIFILGLLLAIVLDANTLTIASRLSTDSTLRSAVVAQAGAFSNDPNALKPDFEKNKSQLESLGLPIGRPNGIEFVSPRNPNFNWWRHVFYPLFGWLLTAGAISLGAPFWFDLLNKFMVIRATVKPHEKSPEEGSEDRQVSSTQVTTTTTQPPAQGSATTRSTAFVDVGSRMQGFTPEPEFKAEPDALDNESHLDEGDLPIETVTPDENLPPAEGGVG